MTASQLIERAKNSPSVAYHRFVLLSNKYKNDLFCFFEGNDSPYYSPRIESTVNKNCHPIICGNKKSVIKVKQLIDLHSVYKNYHTSFFIDRDFDETMKDDNSNLYETPCYSVENFYVGNDTFSKILKNEFQLIEEDEEYKLAVQTFIENKEAFHNASVAFNAWYAMVKSKCNDSCTNVCLGDKFPKDFIILKIGTIKSNYELHDIEEKFPDAIKISEDEIQNKIKELKSESLDISLRGKYEILFLYEFLRFLIEDANNSKKRKILKSKTKFNVDKAQILSQLSQYAKTPDCLFEFLKKYN